MFDVPQDQPNPSAIVYHINPILAGIIKIPPKDELNPSYAKLPRTTKDEQNITELITSLGSYSYVALLKNEKHIRKIGDEVRYVHPFKFLGYIFSQPTLKSYMKNVMNDFFIRRDFIKDMTESLEIYVIKRRLDLYVDDFGKELNIPPDQIRPYINNKDWGGLLKFLTDY